MRMATVFMVVLGMLWTARSGAQEDDRDRPAREPTAAELARMPAELPGEPGPPDPTLDAFLAWNAGLDSIREDREHQLRLAAARRVAPFDLSFGLE